MARRSFPVSGGWVARMRDAHAKVLLFLQLTNMASRIEPVGNRRVGQLAVMRLP